MRRGLTLLKILAAALIVSGIAVWVYLFIFASAPATPADSVGGLLPTGGAASNDPMPAGQVVAGETSSTQTFSLLTTRRVAGAVMFSRDSSPVVRFVEQGTGHAYELTEVGEEMRVSNTTLGRAQRAIWAPTGNRVAVIQETDNGLTTFVGTIQRNDTGTEGLIGETLPFGAENVGFSVSGDVVYYTLPSANGSSGVAWNIASDARQTLFSIPLRDITVSWSPTPIIFTKPAATLMGHAYTVSLLPAAAGMLGLVGEQSGVGDVLATGILDGNISTTLTTDAGVIELEAAALPEKCAFTNNDATLVCAVPQTIDASAFPDRWYRGQEIFSDDFWLVDTQTGRATLLLSPMTEISRELDVVDLVVDASGSNVLFRNKTDASLWLMRR